MNDSTYRLKIRQEVEKTLSQIVRQVKTLVDTTHPEKNGVEMAQLSNFLGVTRETGSVEVVQNWVRYQMGREHSPWPRQGFGDTLLEHIAGWGVTAKGIAAES